MLIEFGTFIHGDKEWVRVLNVNMQNDEDIPLDVSKWLDGKPVICTLLDAIMVIPSREENPLRDEYIIRKHNGYTLKKFKMIVNVIRYCCPKIIIKKNTKKLDYLGMKEME